MPLEDRIEWIKKDTINMAKAWKEAQGELTDFQKGVLAGRWDVINFLEGSHRYGNDI